MGSEERYYKTTDGVRRKEKSISPARINVLIKGVKDIWQTAILKKKTPHPIKFSVLLLPLLPLHSYPFGLGQGSELVRDLCQDLEGFCDADTER